MIPKYYLFEKYYGGEYIVKHDIKRLFREIYHADNIFKFACKYNIKKIINSCIELNIFNYKSALIGACEGGNLELFNILIKKINNYDKDYHDKDYYDLYYYSSKGGNLKIIESLSKIIKIDIPRIIEGACSGGHFEIFNLYIKDYEKYENNNIQYIELLKYSFIGGNLNIIIFILNKIKEKILENTFIESFYNILNSLIINKQITIFKIMLNIFTVDFNNLNYYHNDFMFMFTRLFIKHFLKDKNEDFNLRVYDYKIYINKLKLYNKIQFKKYSRYILI